MPSCSQHPLKSKAEQGLQFRKASIPRGYSMSSHTNILWNIIRLIYKAYILNQKQHYSLMSVTIC